MSEDVSWPARKSKPKKRAAEKAPASDDRAELEALLESLKRVARGELQTRLEPHGRGIHADIARAFNQVATRTQKLSDELVRVEKVAGPEVSRVLGAVAKGDLSQKMAFDIEGQPLKGEFRKIALTVNGMVDQLASFSVEVTRVSKEVGTLGKLGGQAAVPNAQGIWRDLTDNVNLLANNLTSQVRSIAEVTTAVAKGDLSRKITVEAKGELDELKTTINTMVEQLRSFAGEVTRVAREVGTEGKLGGQAQVQGVSGVWKDLTDNVNIMASNLTTQVRGIVKVVTAVANGDLTQTLVVDAKGEIAALADTLNSMTKTLGIFAQQVTSVARTVGVEGKLGAQAEVPGVAGTWKDLTDNVNVLAGNLTDQVRNIAKVTTAVANGDLSQKITVSVKGEILELKDTINTMVDQLRSFASEVTRVAKEVGTEGKLGGQAQVSGVSGTWKDLTDNVNVLAGNLTDQVRNIAKVTTAVADGDLSQKITVEARGEILALKNTINTMVDQLRSFASEVTRVAKEVGTDGKLGGQAQVRDVSGTWKDLTDNVNSMASNLTGQVRNIALVTTAVANGDLSKKITVDVKGEILELKNTINTMVDQLNSFASEVTRVAKEVGTEGKLGGQAEVVGVGGTWKDLTDNVNFMASNLTTQVRGIVKVVTAVANGDLSQKLVGVEAKGEILALAETINSMCDTLGIFADQVTTVASEVGIEGKLGGQAKVPGVAGTWKDLTDNVNFMASNLTTQVRGIVKVVTAVANGDLSQKLVGVEAKGEILALAETINSMCDTLGIFADQVTTVASEVGIQGQLGGQAKVPGAMGTWRQLTDNVNQLAANLTGQVRAISDVATAVTKGDLTRSIDVQALGEVAALKDNINQMIVNLRETTQKNQEQDWLKTNLALFSSMMQGQKDLQTITDMIMSQLTPLVGANYGAFFMLNQDGGKPVLELMSSYAYSERKGVSHRFQLRQGLVGQCAYEKKAILITNVPADYVTINSGLGESSPLTIIVLPVLFEGEVKGVIELASFRPFLPIHQLFLGQLTESIGVVLNVIIANMRTTELLAQSQGLTTELQTQSRELTTQQDELKRTNLTLEKQALDLEEKARQLANQNRKVEEKNREVEQARVAVEEKATQLALISKYKSEFLANMSHELRTPLNSLLILAKLLSDNTDKTLTDKQVEYARTIHGSGVDLLALINEILDLSKVESGKMRIEPRTLELQEIADFVTRTFEPVAEQKSLSLKVEIQPDSRQIETDPQRLQQILKNLLSNAFKFTDQGGVSLHVGLARAGTKLENPNLVGASRVFAFEVQDTGIGIPQDKQRIIFEAFQQVDGTTNRKYGGTGLGLSISRELARLLGGEIHVTSAPKSGSTFTLYLPEHAPLVVQDEDLTKLPTPRPPNVLPARTPAQLAAPTHGTVLVVDDDFRNIFAMSSILEGRGLNVIYAEDGRGALEALEQNSVDLVLLDIMMPEMDGYETIEAIRKNDAHRGLPIVAVTAKALPEDREKCLEVGANDYLPKPVDPDRLLEIIDRYTSEDVSREGAGAQA